MKFISLLTCCFLLIPFSPLFAQTNEDKMDLLKFLEQEQIPAEDLLPADIEVSEDFEPGIGLPIGEVQEAHGTVFVIHKDGGKAFNLRQQLPVFRGDTLITRQDSRVTLLMVDKSALVLAAHSKLVLEKSLYRLDARKEKRNSKLQLLFGRIRSFVSKVAGDSDYTITTPTAVAGVRGTDFVLAVGPVLRVPSECGTFFLPRSPVSSERYSSENDGLVPSLMTVLITGENNSTVEFTDSEGRSPVVVGSLSMTGILSGCTGREPSYLGRNALNFLQDIGPELNRLREILRAKQKQPSEFMLNALQRTLEDLNRTPVSPVHP